MAELRSGAQQPHDPDRPSLRLSVHPPDVVWVDAAGRSLLEDGGPGRRRDGARARRRRRVSGRTTWDFRGRIDGATARGTDSATTWAGCSGPANGASGAEAPAPASTNGTPVPGPTPPSRTETPMPGTRAPMPPAPPATLSPAVAVATDSTPAPAPTTPAPSVPLDPATEYFEQVARAHAAYLQQQKELHDAFLAVTSWTGLFGGARRDAVARGPHARPPRRRHGRARGQRGDRLGTRRSRRPGISPEPAPDRGVSRTVRGSAGDSGTPGRSAARDSLLAIEGRDRSEQADRRPAPMLEPARPSRRRSLGPTPNLPEPGNRVADPRSSSRSHASGSDLRRSSGSSSSSRTATSARSACRSRRSSSPTGRSSWRASPASMKKGRVVTETDVDAGLLVPAPRPSWPRVSSSSRARRTCS